MVRRTSRRQFCKGGFSALSVLGATWTNLALPKTETAKQSLISRPGLFPRWRGFNLEALTNQTDVTPYLETDFQMISHWGFNFVRLPVSYQDWNLYVDLTQPKFQTVAGLTSAYSGGTHATALSYLDRAIEWGRRYGIHVQINLYRAPGYCVIGHEQLKLFDETEGNGGVARAQFALQWGFLASRFADIAPVDLSFNLLNEPGNVSSKSYILAMMPAIDQIRSYSPNRLVMVDGLDYSTRPVIELDLPGVSESTHAAYFPKQLSNYKSKGAKYDMRPNWPLNIEGRPEDDYFPLRYNEKGRVTAKSLIEFGIMPWLAIRNGVMMGEWGCNSNVPHSVALAWMHDWLVVMKQYDMGWALWNFRGSWSFLDSGRTDCAYTIYTDSAGSDHQVDRSMLALLQSF